MSPSQIIIHLSVASHMGSRCRHLLHVLSRGGRVQTSGEIWFSSTLLTMSQLRSRSPDLSFLTLSRWLTMWLSRLWSHDEEQQPCLSEVWQETLQSDRLDFYFDRISDKWPLVWRWKFKNTSASVFYVTWHHRDVFFINVSNDSMITSW